MDAKAPARPRLLVVDDDPSCRESLGEFFLREGFTVRVAATGTEAMQLLLHERVHASVMDVHMPGLTGPEVLEALISRKGVGHVPPTIFVSSDSAAADVVRRTLEIDVGFVPKPIRLEALRRSLWNLMVRTYVKPQPGLPPPLENLLPPGSLL